MPEGDIGAATRDYDLEAVRADDPKQMRARCLEHGLLERAATVRAAFPEDDRRLGAPSRRARR